MEKRDGELIRSLMDRDAELRDHYLEHERFQEELARLNAKQHFPLKRKSSASGSRS